MHFWKVLIYGEKKILVFCDVTCDFDEILNDFYYTSVKIVVIPEDVSEFVR